MVGDAPEDHAPALAKIEASGRPLLVLVGSKDEAFKVDRYGTALGTEKSALRIIDGASHDSVLVDPRALQAVGERLGAHPAATVQPPTT